MLLPNTEDYGLHAKVYGCGRVLWRTRQLLAGHDSIEYPQAYRTWIERVYQTEPWPDEPAEVTEQYEQFVQDEFGRYFSARQLSKSDATPWPDTEGGAAKLTRDGDTSLNVLLVQQSAKGLALLDGRRLDTLAEHEHDELISLNTVGVPAGWAKWLEASEEDTYRLVLQRTSDDRWEGQSRDRQFVYTENLGLMGCPVSSG